MKTLSNSLVVALLISALATATVSVSAGIPKDPQRVAAYQVGIYGSADGTKLNVAVDKGAGGRVNVALKNEKGAVLFQQLIGRSAEKYRGKLDISSLAPGTYRLEISNGTETMVRNLTIANPEPEVAVRTIALL